MCINIYLHASASILRGVLLYRVFQSLLNLFVNAKYINKLDINMTFLIRLCPLLAAQYIFKGYILV